MPVKLALLLVPIIAATAIFLSFSNPFQSQTSTIKSQIRSGVAAASIASVTLSPTDDSCVFLKSNVIRGAYPQMYFTSGADSVSFPYLKFDLSSIPARVKVSKATLKMRQIYQTTDNISSMQIDILKVTRDWNEETLKSNNRPADTPLDPNRRMYVITTVNAQEWDITNIVQSWVDGTSPNYGIYFKHLGSSTIHVRRFGSKESDVLAERPLLVVEYETVITPTPTPTTAPVPAYPSLVVKPVADTYIDSSVSEQNNAKGGSDILCAANIPHNQYMLIKFDLQKILRDSQIHSAILKLYGSSKSENADIKSKLAFYFLKADWNENTVDWSNAPKEEISRQPDVYLFNLKSVPVTTDQNDQWMEFNLMSMVQKWVNNSYPNYGMLIKISSTVNTNLCVTSSAQNTKPSLEIKYSLGPQIAPITDVSDTYARAKDVWGPKISDIKLKSVSDITATITWITDEISNSTIVYGPTSRYNNGRSASGEWVKKHSLTIDDLEPNTTYHFKVKSRDKADNLSLSRERTFKTNKEVVNLNEGNVLENIIKHLPWGESSSNNSESNSDNSGNSEAPGQSTDQQGQPENVNVTPAPEDFGAEESQPIEPELVEEVSQQNQGQPSGSKEEGSGAGNVDESTDSDVTTPVPASEQNGDIADQVTLEVARVIKSFSNALREFGQTLSSIFKAFTF